MNNVTRLVTARATAHLTLINRLSEVEAILTVGVSVVLGN